MSTRLDNDTAESDIPIYVPSMSPDFFNCIGSAAEAVWDDGQDPSQVEAYECRIGKAYVPHLVDIVEESWYMEYDDVDAYDVEIPEPLRSELSDIYKRLCEAAPTVWTPILYKRVTLPAIDCPECGYPSDKPWPSDSGDCKYCGRPDDRDVDTGPDEDV